jgi:hypothetical protein
VIIIYSGGQKGAGTVNNPSMLMLIDFLYYKRPADGRTKSTFADENHSSLWIQYELGGDGYPSGRFSLYFLSGFKNGFKVYLGRNKGIFGSLTIGDRAVASG